VATHHRVARQQAQLADGLTRRSSDGGERVRINIFNSRRGFGAAAGQSLLDAALNASFNLPHGCRGGNCGACQARLLSGEVTYPNGPPLGLSDAEIADGMILLCQAQAATDLTIETFEVRAAEQASIKRLPCRIERMAVLSHDVMGVFLRLPAAESFVFEAGQYVDIMLPGGHRRSYSIASPPHAARPLELHVRHVAGGEFSDRLLRENQAGALLAIEGPLGQFVYRPGASPMLLIGGGTGIAPLLSVLRHVVENGIERDITLYWGVRAECDLYAHEILKLLANRAAHVRYHPVLSEPSAAWRGLTGLVHEAPLKDIDDLTPYEVYAAGPPAMIAAVRRDFGVRGHPASRLYFDAFDYARDISGRQRTSADTKS
jgi:CDP-4-dehydro-6-deoxyglucose reductase, E3